MGFGLATTYRGDGNIILPDPYFANVVSLLHFDGVNGSPIFTDQIPGRVWTPVNGMAISTAQSVFGGASGLSGSAIAALISDTPASDFTFGTGDFTIEFAHRTPASLASFYFPLDFRSASGDVKPCFLYNGAWQYYTAGSVRITGSPATVNTWYRIAYSRVSGVGRLFVNGTQQGSNYVDSNNYVQCRAIINGAGDNPGTFGANTWWDELRITKGIGRYTTNYIPDAVAFPNS